MSRDLLEDDEDVRAAVRALADRIPLRDPIPPRPDAVRLVPAGNRSGFPRPYRILAVAAVLLLVVGVAGVAAVLAGDRNEVVVGSPRVAEPAGPTTVDRDRTLLEGSVVDEDGRGIGGAVVEVMVLEEFGADQRVQVGEGVRLRTVGTARSDADGRFVVVLDPAFAVDDPRLLETPGADPPSTNFRVYAFAPGRSGLWFWPGALVMGPTGPRWIDGAHRDAGPSAPAASVTITMQPQNPSSTTVPAPTAPPVTETLTTKNPPREG